MNNASVIENKAWRIGSKSPALSVLVPYFRFDCCQLVSELCRQMGSLDQPAELLLADDGSGDADLNNRIAGLLENTPVPVHWKIYPQNTGRASIRNNLLDNARGEYLLFLDCDMLPDRDNFLQLYLDEIARQPDTAVFIGGRSYHRLAEYAKSCELYRYFSERTECIPAEQRQMHAAWYVFTNNMVVRRSVMRKFPFDTAFIGWGYEDTDWGIRVAKTNLIRHLDNTATHLGLIHDRELLAKYRSSADNYLRIFNKHPGEISKFRVSRLALKLRQLKWLNQAIAAGACKAAAAAWLPLPIRYAALQIYRASLYALALAGKATTSPVSSS